MNDFEDRARAAAERLRRRANELAGHVELFAAAQRPVKSGLGTTASRATVIIAVAAVGIGGWAILAQRDDNVSVTGDSLVRSSAPPAPTVEPQLTTADPTTVASTTTESSTTTAPGQPTGITRPFVDAAMCRPISARTAEFDGYTLHLFALSRESPIPIQVIGDPHGGPTQPFALVERLFTSDISTQGQRAVTINASTVSISTYPNGNGEARWELPDGSRAYLRSRGLDQPALEAIIGRLSPRDRDADIPGFDYHGDRSDELGLELVAEHLNTNIAGTSATLECQVYETGYDYTVTALEGDPIFEYSAVIDRPPPLHVGTRDQTLVVIGGLNDSAAPTVADVVNADPDQWRRLLASPTLIDQETAGPTRTLAIGDSVMLGAADELAAGGVVVDTKVSRLPDEAIDLVAELRERDLLGNTVVVHLGNNGPFTPTSLEALMSELEGVPHVVVLTDHNRFEWAASNNRLLRALPQRYGSVEVIDWDELATQCRGECLYSDGVHLTPKGQRYYAQHILQAIDS